MVDQWFLKVLLFPLAVLYGLGVAIRNGLYSAGLLKGVSFNIPVISIGNLSVGGTGKTPHTEYLIRLLREHLKLAVLSRGYRRQTSGYLEVMPQHDALQSGDEPLQYKRKYPDIQVVVAESRGLAIPLLLRSYPDIQVVILDDGFQHREVTPGLNVLLTEYNQLYTRDWLLPVGRLREWRDSADHADMIIVTKCPEKISSEEMLALQKEVRRNDRQQIFFSKFFYGLPYRMYGAPERFRLSADIDVLLVVAIAGTEYLLEYVESACGEVKMMEYQDHHSFSNFDIGNIELHFKTMDSGRQKIILTTEKDAVRLDVYRELLQSLSLPLYILPVAVQFENGQIFDHAIREWLLNFKL
ncbi:MAG: tetraacyldisaccharide 4'-kinase [Saprospiraceae bacterium]